MHFALRHIACLLILVELGGTTVLYRGTAVLIFHGTSTVEVTVLPWYRNTTNTALLPYRPGVGAGFDSEPGQKLYKAGLLL